MTNRISKILLACVAAFPLVACMPSTRPANDVDAAEYAPEPDDDDEVLLSKTRVGQVEIAEAFVSPLTPEHDVDSPASWRHPDGSTWVITSAKATDRLVVYDGDDGRTRTVSRVLARVQVSCAGRTACS